ncbi:hypothetical protein Lal_00028374 [Lupinus albus]|nr:hypothetical protein Lal_00028374 [Lupinus albus]
MVELYAKGQPLNMKGDNMLVSYIGVVSAFDVGGEHKNYILKTAGKSYRQFRVDVRKYVRDSEGNINLKPPTKYTNIIQEADWKIFPTRRNMSCYKKNRANLAEMQDMLKFLLNQKVAFKRRRMRGIKNVTVLASKIGAQLLVIAFHSSLENITVPDMFTITSLPLGNFTNRGLIILKDWNSD